MCTAKALPAGVYVNNGCAHRAHASCTRHTLRMTLHDCQNGAACAAAPCTQTCTSTKRLAACTGGAPSQTLCTMHAGHAADTARRAQLALHADLYVNDAFGCAHRAHASTEGVTHHLRPCVAGLLMQKVRALRMLSPACSLHGWPADAEGACAVRCARHGAQGARMRNMHGSLSATSGCLMCRSSTSGRRQSRRPGGPSAPSHPMPCTLGLRTR